MLTLYHAPHSRSSRFIWLLEELAVPYEIHRVDIRRGDGGGALDASNPHPHGKVPVIDHDGVIVYESIAVALYLTAEALEKLVLFHAVSPFCGRPSACQRQCFYNRG